MTKLTEDIIEQTALEYLASLGFDLAHGSDITFDGITPERDAQANYSDVVLVNRLRNALTDINSHLPGEAIVDAFRKRLIEIKNDTPPNFIPGDEDKMKSVFSALDSEVQKTAAALKDKIQMEEGSYRVDLTIEYESITRLINCQRKAKSSVSFKIDSDARDKIISNVPSTLFTIGRNWIFNEQGIVSYPEYQPSNIVEL